MPNNIWVKGEVSAQFRFDAFGGMYAGILAPYNHMGLTGKDYDAKSGLIDFGARWYDPFSGRFTQADTYKGQLGFPATQHAYAYTGNNPINNIDPTGHYTDPGGTYHEISDEEYEDLANQQGVDTTDPNSPWKDIVDQNLDNQYNQGHSGGGGGDDDDGGSSGGGGYTPPPPSKEQRQAALNAVLSSAKQHVKEARESDQATKTSTKDVLRNNVVQKPSTLSYEKDRYYNPETKTKNDKEGLKKLNNVLSIVSGVTAIAAVGAAVIATAVPTAALATTVSILGLISYSTGAVGTVASAVVTIKEPSPENFVSLGASALALAFGTPGAKSAVNILRSAEKFALTGWDVMSRTWSMFGAGLSY